MTKDLVVRRDPKHTTDDEGVLAEVRFVPELPGRSQTNARRDAIRKLLPALKARPNVWAAICEHTSRQRMGNVVIAFRKNRFGPSDHWEAAVRLNPETKVHVVYARYVGPPVDRLDHARSIAGGRPIGPNRT